MTVCFKMYTNNSIFLVYSIMYIISLCFILLIYVVRVFSEAVYVIAIHGNGLTNLLWLSGQTFSHKSFTHNCPHLFALYYFAQTN